MGTVASRDSAQETPRGGPKPDWYADPTGRHEYRYWDGGAWTANVADAGSASLDPLAESGSGGTADRASTGGADSSGRTGSARETESEEQTVTRAANLVGHLRQFREAPAVLYQQPEYSELLEIGRDLDERGGYQLMLKVAKAMAPRVTAPPNPYVGDQVTDSLSDINGYWDGIGDWQA
jgi:hypothetical protein